MKKYIGECIGTFFWTFILLLVLNNGTGALAPMAMGAILIAMSSATGGHFNPVVSLAVLLRGKLSRQDFPYYVVAQLLGAVLAALMATFLLRSGGSPLPEARGHEMLPALLAEFFGAFALAYVALHGTTSRSDAGPSHYGLAIGCTLIGVYYALGSISGGAFNPAVALGMSIGGMVPWDDLWMYLLGDLLGAAAAATICQVMDGLQE